VGIRTSIPQTANGKNIVRAPGVPSSVPPHPFSWGLRPRGLRTIRHTLFDHKRNEELLEGLKVQPVDEKLRRYISNWLQHVTRMNSRMPKIRLNYKSNEGNLEDL
jgi:hypothetical protein